MCDLNHHVLADAKNADISHSSYYSTHLFLVCYNVQSLLDAITREGK
jgi:hypothetical protein